MSYDLFKGYGIPIELEDDDSFLKVRETLTRIGIGSIKRIENPSEDDEKFQKTLWQSCLILHKRGYYHILHFKELFLLDGKKADLSENDIARRNTIALLLEDWGLLTIKDKSKIEDNTVPLNQIKILTHKEKSEWILDSKYSIGKRKNS